MQTSEATKKTFMSTSSGCIHEARRHRYSGATCLRSRNATAVWHLLSLKSEQKVLSLAQCVLISLERSPRSSRPRPISCPAASVTSLYFLDCLAYVSEVLIGGFQPPLPWVICDDVLLLHLILLRNFGDACALPVSAWWNNMAAVSDMPTCHVEWMSPSCVWSWTSCVRQLAVGVTWKVVLSHSLLFIYCLLQVSVITTQTILVAWLRAGCFAMIIVWVAGSA